MTLFSTIRRSNNSRKVVAVVLFVWLSLLVTPCAMAVVVDQPTSDEVSSSQHDHSGGPECVESDAAMAGDCCCEGDLAAGNERRSLESTAIIAALVANALPQIRYLDKPKPPFQADRASPPPRSVYLVTQRLRI